MKYEKRFRIWNFMIAELLQTDKSIYIYVLLETSVNVSDFDVIHQSPVLVQAGIRLHMAVIILK